MSTRLIILAGIFILAALATVFFGYETITAPGDKASVETSMPHSIKLAALPAVIERAETSAKMERGLSGRMSLPDDYGMLFIFSVDASHGFWMKDMLIPIDIVWLAADGTILHIEESVAPSTYPTIFQPQVAARYVLETPAGYIKKQKLEVGTQFDMSGYQNPEPI